MIQSQWTSFGPYFYTTPRASKHGYNGGEGKEGRERRGGERSHGETLPADNDTHSVQTTDLAQGVRVRGFK